MLKQEQVKYKLHQSLCSAPEDRSLYIHVLLVEYADPQSVFSSLSVCVCVYVCVSLCSDPCCCRISCSACCWMRTGEYNTQQVSSWHSQKGRGYFSNNSDQIKKNTPD